MKYEFIKKINVPMSALVSFIAVSLFKEVTIGMSILGVGVCALFGFKMWMDHIKKPDPTQEIYDEINKLKGAINVMKMGITMKSTDEKKNVRYF